jgi:large conductance mechanosensitive channel
MWQEFKEFISRGNVIDLAIAVVIGAAFTAIVNSLVNDIITPLIGVLLGGLDFSSLAFQVGEATIAYGNFIQAIINFLLVALVLFLIIKGMNEAQRVTGLTKKEEVIAPAEPTAEEKLLTEIRDLLREQQR